MSFIQNAVVLITGANRGIGRSLVEGALQRGARKVYAAVRRPESAQELVQQFGFKVVPLRLDLEVPSSIEEAARLAQDTQVVVHNAGIAEMGGVLDPTAVQQLEHQMLVNASGLIRVAQAFAPVLKAQGGGTLAQLNSVASIKTFAAGATYSASKAAAYAITQALREELAAQGTHVVSVHPGPIATDMARQAGFFEQAEPASVVGDALFEAIEQKRFHVFPDSFARSFWQGYESYARSVVEAPFGMPAAH